jgi:hypothetical protein
MTWSFKHREPFNRAFRIPQQRRLLMLAGAVRCPVLRGVRWINAIRDLCWYRFEMRLSEHPGVAAGVDHVVSMGLRPG